VSDLSRYLTPEVIEQAKGAAFEVFSRYHTPHPPHQNYPWIPLADCDNMAEGVISAAAPLLLAGVVEENERLTQERDAADRLTDSYRQNLTMRNNEVTALRAALQKYGSHTAQCPECVASPRTWGSGCTCGLDAALEGK